MDDFENDLATALRAAVRVPPTEIDPDDIVRSTVPGTSRRLAGPALGGVLIAAAVVAAVLLVVHARNNPVRTTPGTSPAVSNRSLAGRWVLRTVVDQGRVVAIPPSLGAYLDFKGDQLTGFNGCNYFSGTVRYPSDDTIEANGGITLKLCVGDTAKVAAMKSTELTIFANKGPVHAALDRDNLTLKSRGYKLDYWRG